MGFGGAAPIQPCPWQRVLYLRFPPPTRTASVGLVRFPLGTVMFPDDLRCWQPGCIGLERWHGLVRTWRWNVRLARGRPTGEFMGKTDSFEQNPSDSWNLPDFSEKITCELLRTTCPGGKILVLAARSGHDGVRDLAQPWTTHVPTSTVPSSSVSCLSGFNPWVPGTSPTPRASWQNIGSGSGGGRRSR